MRPPKRYHELGVGAATYRATWSRVERSQHRLLAGEKHEGGIACDKGPPAGVDGDPVVREQEEQAPRISIDVVVDIFDRVRPPFAFTRAAKIARARGKERVDATSLP
mmetsp:Transcript_22630/g.59159  ORF Transcript_22630/g.59159 Transcript_22630/m.59159 type:complete len:107 (-) Transcript_22630:346-666(-)